MRLFTLLILLFGIVQTSAYSVPGGHEGVLIYYLYRIDTRLHGGQPQKIATVATEARPVPLINSSAILPAGDVPSDPFPEPGKDAGFPDMDTTAKALWTKDKKGRDWAGTINTGRSCTSLD